MSRETTRREMLGHTVRATGLIGLGGAAAYLTTKADSTEIWQLDAAKCVNSRLGVTDAKKVCDLCATECVLPLSAVRAVNDFDKCGRCYICPAYFDVMSELDYETADDPNKFMLPKQKLCPRDAIKREPIGYIDESDPANNFYEYIIDEVLCNGCGKCVMGCKEPAGLGSIRLEVRHNLCLDCNRCTISQACPDEAYVRSPIEQALAMVKRGI